MGTDLDLGYGNPVLAESNLAKYVMQGDGILLNVGFCSDQTPHGPVPLHLHSQNVALL